MKDYDFKIKISDLLKKSGTKDSLILEKKFSTNIPQLHEKGIYCEIDLIGLDSKTLLVTIKKGSAQLDTHCDICGKSMQQPLYIEKQSVKVFVGGEPELANDDVLIINESDGVIDFEEYITNSLLLIDDVVHSCQECKNSEQTNNEISEGGSIIWKY